MTIDWDDKYARNSLTFDDVLLVQHVLAISTDVSTMLTRASR